MAEWSEKQAALSRFLRHAMTDPRLKRKGMSRGGVLNQFDPCHETLLPYVSDVRQSAERPEQPG